MSTTTTTGDQRTECTLRLDGLPQRAPPDLAEALARAGTGHGHVPWGDILTLGWQVWSMCRRGLIQGHGPDPAPAAGTPPAAEEDADADGGPAEGGLRQLLQDTQWRLRSAEDARDRAIDRYQTLEADVERRVRECVADVNRMRDRDAEHYHTRIEQETVRIRDMCSGIQMGEVARLREALRATECELAVLRGHNATKGVQGQALVMAVLQRTFTDHEVVDVSGRPHAGDIDLVAPQGGSRVMVECKNKAHIPNTDTARFLSDLRTHRPDAIGGVFVSVRCPGIPGRGSFSVETVAETRQLVLFVAFEGGDECATQLGGYVRPFVALRQLLHRLSNEPNTQAHWEERYRVVIADMQFVYEGIHRQQVLLRQFVATQTKETQSLLERMTGHLAGAQFTEVGATRKRSRRAVGGDPD